MIPGASRKLDSMCRIAMAILVALVPIFPPECCGCCANQETNNCSNDDRQPLVPAASPSAAKRCCQRASDKCSVPLTASEVTEARSQPDATNATERNCCSDLVSSCSASSNLPSRSSSDGCPCCSHGHLPIHPLLSEPAATTTGIHIASYLFEPPAGPARGNASSSLGGSKAEVPPPSHNRQQALLCVWLN